MTFWSLSPRNDISVYHRGMKFRLFRPVSQSSLSEVIARACVPLSAHKHHAVDHSNCTDFCQAYNIQGQRTCNTHSTCVDESLCLCKFVTPEFDQYALHQVSVNGNTRTNFRHAYTIPGATCRRATQLRRKCNEHGPSVQRNMQHACGNATGYTMLACCKGSAGRFSHRFGNDHHYIGHNYTGHNYIGHKHIGHNYLGHNHIGQ